MISNSSDSDNDILLNAIPEKIRRRVDGMESFRRRFASALLLLPLVSFLVPPSLILSLKVLSSLSGNHEYLTILLSVSFTFYFRKLIDLHAPDSKKREEAIIKCARRLPLGSLLGVAMFLRYLVPWSGGKSISWDVSLGLRWGVRLSLASLCVSLIVGGRYAGPFRVVTSSNTVLSRNPYETLLTSFFPTLDHFLQTLTFPPSFTPNHRHPTLHKTLAQTAFHSALGVALGVLCRPFLPQCGGLDVATRLTAPIVLVWWRDSFVAGGLDLDSNAAGPVSANLAWPWKGGEARRMLSRQLRTSVPLQALFCGTYVMWSVSEAGGVTAGALAVLGPSLLLASVAITLCLVTTELILRLFLSQRISLSKIPESTLLQSLLERDLVPSLTAPLKPYSDFQQEEIFRNEEAISKQSKLLLQASADTLPQSIFRTVILSSLSRDDHNFQPSDLTVVVFILRGFAAYLGGLGQILKNVPKDHTLSLPASTMTHLHFTLLSTKNLFDAHHLRHTHLSLLIPPLLHSLRILHTGILAFSKNNWDDKDPRRGLALCCPKLGAILQTLEDLFGSLARKGRDEEVLNSITMRDFQDLTGKQ